MKNWLAPLNSHSLSKPISKPAYTDDKSQILESDTRDMVRLLGNVAAQEGTLVEKRKFLMDGLCRLIGADAWVWAMVGSSEAGESVTFSVYLKGGFTEKQFAKYLTANEHEDMRVIQTPFLEEFSAKKNSHHPFTSAN